MGVLNMNRPYSSIHFQIRKLGVQSVFHRLIITFFIATLFTVNSRANPLAQLDNVEARASYCFYAFTINIQLASKELNRMKVLTLLKPYKDWDNVLKDKFPDKNTRNDELAKAALQFETDVGSRIASNNLSQPAAQQSLIDSISDDCKAEFEK